MNNEINYTNLLVDKEDDNVRYNDELHKYWTKDENMNCISVTTLIHKFTTFDEEFWSCYKTLERLISEDKFKEIKPQLLDKKIFKEEYYLKFNILKENFDKEKEILLKEWNDKRETSCIRGSEIHKKHELEHLAGNTKELQSLKLGGAFTTINDNKIKLGEKGVYPELLISRISNDGKLRVAGQADLIIIDNNDLYVLDYKGLDLNTPILTTLGFKLLKDITLKDVIFDKDGNETKIKNISKVHYKPCYKIVFDNGEEVIADHEHRWLISFRQTKNKFKEVILTTEEIKNAYDLYLSKEESRFLPKIINAKPLNRVEIKLPIDPYILGYWLGDGTSVAGSITAQNKDF